MLSFKKSLEWHFFHLLLMQKYHPGLIKLLLLQHTALAVSSSLSSTHCLVVLSKVKGGRPVIEPNEILRHRLTDNAARFQHENLSDPATRLKKYTTMRLATWSSWWLKELLDILETLD